MTQKDYLSLPLLEEALQQLQAAIALLDRVGAPGHIAAHVDLAVNQLQDLLPSSRSGIIPLQADDEDHGITSTLWPCRPH